MTRKFDCIGPLVRAGIDYDDAMALRRISMTLRRWHELECGNGNDSYSWSVVRGRKETRYGQHAGGHGPHCVFVRDDNGKPFIKRHSNRAEADGTYRASWTPTPDRETGAKKRLAKIMARYPKLRAYIQTDPRGAALYILRPGDVPEGEDAGSYYTRGLVVC